MMEENKFPKLELNIKKVGMFANILWKVSVIALRCIYRDLTFEQRELFIQITLDKIQE